MVADARLDEALLLLDPPPGRPPWAGGATVLGCLRGVGAKQAAWKPASDRASVWELALHVAYWKYAVRRKLEGGEKGGFERSPSNFPALPDRLDEAAWRTDRALLRDEHVQLVGAIRSFDQKRLDEETGKYRFADLIFGIAMHDVHHVGQIQLIKRLYRGTAHT
jgi:uncharacterized damage-inducible protein DinB